MKKPLKIGVTGGIGCGKSFICELFTLRDIEVYNADFRVAKDIIRKPHIKSQVEEVFGLDSYNERGDINRDKFRKLLFPIKENLDKMNAIILPELMKDMEEWYSNQTGEYVLFECAIIYDVDIQGFFDKILVVDCPLKTRYDRLLKRGMTHTEINNVMSSQLSDDKRFAKIRSCDYIITNDDYSSSIVRTIKTLDKGLRLIYEDSLASEKTGMLPHTGT
jgi:dephospho-CoA kinase